ncbi:MULTISPECIES: DUF1877 family protein [unclassified Streptomyces]|uniref:DUF1877 family protein n=1 Tax=unclassified Streptomyces TaxID=2593676 RepID=UPI003660743B
MGMSVTKWRLTEDEFIHGIDFLESRFEAAQDEEDWGEETDFSNFCEIGELWDLVNVTISGVPIPTQGVGSLVVLGGDMLGEVGDPGGLITVLTRQEVTEVAHFLRGLSIDSIVTTCEQLSDLPDFVISEVRQKLRDLQHFYALATQEGHLMVTRVYGP